MIREVLIVSMIALAIGLTSSCVEDLPRVTDIEDPRPLGTRVQLPDDDTLVWPERGSTARVSWEIVYPKLEMNTDAIESMFIVCTPAPVNAAIPLCLEFFALMNKHKGADQDLSDLIGIERLTCEQLEQLKSDQSELFDALAFEILCVQGEPSFEITIPEDPIEDELLVLGVMCDKGKAFFDPSREAYFGCELEDGGEEMKVFYFVPLQPEDIAPNHHPNLDNAVFRIGNRHWPKTSIENLLPYVIPDDSEKESFDCERAVDEGALFEFDAEAQVISVEVQGDDLERFDVDGEYESEELEIAHYATFGELDQEDSVVRSEFEILGFDLKWDPPEKIPEKGLFTRVFFTVRDGRGGFDSAMRAFCVTGE